MSVNDRLLLLLRSSKAVHKSASPMARQSGRMTPHPGSCSMVELLGSYPRGQLDLLRIGEALSCQCFSSKQSPPRFLKVEPARPYWNEDLLHSRVVLQPLSDGWTLVTRKIVSDQVKAAVRVCLGNCFEQPQVAFSVARRSDERESLAVSHPQRTVNPDFLGTPTVLQRCLDAVPIRRPTRGGRIGARTHRP
jgi:hypothetical protein